MIAQLQETRRQFVAVEIPPCGATMQRHLVDAMNQTIDAFLQFQAGADTAVVADLLRKANDSLARSTAELDALNAR